MLAPSFPKGISIYACTTPLVCSFKIKTLLHISRQKANRRFGICPAGKRSQFWMPAIDIHEREVIQVKFAKRDCRACAMRAQCTRSSPPRRTITILPEAQHKALQAARERERTEAFKEQYAQRAGVEGTISQGVRAFGLRRTRYIGLEKTHLQHVLSAAAIDLVRVAHWLAGDIPAQVGALLLCVFTPSLWLDRSSPTVSSTVYNSRPFWGERS